MGDVKIDYLLGNGAGSTDDAYDKKKYAFQIFLIHNVYSGLSVYLRMCFYSCAASIYFGVLLAMWQREQKFVHTIFVPGNFQGARVNQIIYKIEKRHLYP